MSIKFPCVLGREGCPEEHDLKVVRDGHGWKGVLDGHSQRIARRRPTIYTLSDTFNRHDSCIWRARQRIEEFLEGLE